MLHHDSRALHAPPFATITTDVSCHARPGMHVKMAPLFTPVLIIAHVVSQCFLIIILRNSACPIERVTCLEFLLANFLDQRLDEYDTQWMLAPSSSPLPSMGIAQEKMWHCRQFPLRRNRRPRESHPRRSESRALPKERQLPHLKIRLPGCQSSQYTSIQSSESFVSPSSAGDRCPRGLAASLGAVVS